MQLLNKILHWNSIISIHCNLYYLTFNYNYSLKLRITLYFGYTLLRWEFSGGVQTIYRLVIILPVFVWTAIHHYKISHPCPAAIAVYVWKWSIYDELNYSCNTNTDNQRRHLFGSTENTADRKLLWYAWTDVWWMI